MVCFYDVVLFSLFSFFYTLCAVSVGFDVPCCLRLQKKAAAEKAEGDLPPVKEVKENDTEKDQDNTSGCVVA